MSRRSRRRRYGAAFPSDGPVMPHKMDEHDMQVMEMAQAIDWQRPPLKFGVPADPPPHRVKLAVDLYHEPDEAQGLNTIQGMVANPDDGRDC